MNTVTRYEAGQAWRTSVSVMRRVAILVALALLMLTLIAAFFSLTESLTPTRVAVHFDGARLPLGQ